MGACCATRDDPKARKEEKAGLTKDLRNPALDPIDEMTEDDSLDRSKQSRSASATKEHTKLVPKVIETPEPDEDKQLYVIKEDLKKEKPKQS